MKWIAVFALRSGNKKNHKINHIIPKTKEDKNRIYSVYWKRVKKINSIVHMTYADYLETNRKQNLFRLPKYVKNSEDICMEMRSFDIISHWTCHKYRRRMAIFAPFFMVNIVLYWVLSSNTQEPLPNQANAQLKIWSYMAMCASGVCVCVWYVLDIEIETEILKWITYHSAIIRGYNKLWRGMVAC